MTREFLGAVIVTVKPISRKISYVRCWTQKTADYEARTAKNYPWRFAYRINFYAKS